jgi:hypothetical protein
MPCLGDDGRRMTGALAELMSPTALIMGDLAIACYASVSVQKNQATVVTERAKIVAPEIEIRGTVRGALGDPAAKPRQKKTRYNPCDNLRAKGDYERCKATSTERTTYIFKRDQWLRKGTRALTGKASQSIAMMVTAAPPNIFRVNQPFGSVST